MQLRRPTQNDKRDGACVPYNARPDHSHGDSRTKRVKDQKVGEGTYAVVYRGSSAFLNGSLLFTHEHPHVCSPFLSPFPGRELATGRKIAIKKIKVGQFKDGLDMSAVREVKYLRELHHPNIIEVRIFARAQTVRRLLRDAHSVPPHTLSLSSSWTCSRQRRI